MLNHRNMEADKFEEELLIFIDQIENLLQKKMLPEALRMAEERLAAYPADVDAQVFINRILIESGKIEQSRDILRRLGRDISRLSLVYLQAADSYREAGLKQDALICYQKFLTLNPLSDYSSQVVERISRLEKDGISITSDESGSPDEPRPEFYTVTLADLYVQQGHLEMAADILTEIIARDPVNIQAKIKLDAIKMNLTRKKSRNETPSATNNLISILSCWLEHIGRLKHAT
jgi:tetratricopeptide (TPR) repeat protein